MTIFLFQGALPSEETLRLWCKKVDCSPGFSATALDMISRKVEDQKRVGGRVLVSLCLDEMSLRKFVSYSENKFHGNVDLGDGIQSNEQATHALVMVVVSYNMSWKLPIAHFVTKTIPSMDLASLVRLAVVYLNETGAILLNLTMDNAATNVSMINILGANVSCYSKLRISTQERNILNIPILVILDPCHVLKLVRNTLHDFGRIKVSSWIDWF